MNRRDFLQGLTVFTAGMALDPEKLLWVPGQKTIFIPPVQPYLSDAATIYYNRVALEQLTRKFKFSDTRSMGTWSIGTWIVEDEFGL